MIKIAACLGIFLTVSARPARVPVGIESSNYEASPRNAIRYTLRVDPADLTRFSVEMHISGLSDTFHIAMGAHLEYDDRYWRYVEGLHVEEKGGNVIREDSALWRVTVRNGEATIRYRIKLPATPATQRAAWRPFLEPTGGLVGGIHSFMYIPERTHLPSRVILELPPGWDAQTGLEGTPEPLTYSAETASELADCPIFVGFFRKWEFSVGGVRHRIVYWPLPDAVSFDSVGLVNDIQRIVETTVKFFGRTPYRIYTFLLRDGARGALEHRNSLVMGALSTDLASSRKSLLGSIAHEFFHTWNLVTLRPAEHGDIDYRQGKGSRGLWWSEGVTMFYADLLLRRAGLPAFDSTREAHYEKLIARYLGNPGNRLISPEKVSLVSDGPPGMLGDYTASTHLQGELIGMILDLIIRDATDGRRTLDGVMRSLYEKNAGDRGFSGTDIERLISEQCGCDVHPFFESYVRGDTPLDFERYLGKIGLRIRTTEAQELDEDHRPAADVRVYVWQPVEGGKPRLGITDPSSCWGRAGLHTGDQIDSVGGAAAGTAAEIRSFLGKIHIGDTVSLVVSRPTGRSRVAVIVSDYKVPRVRLEETLEATERQKRLRREWEGG